MRKFTISDETIALDLMKEVGPGGTFLTHPHTAKNFRNEIFFRNKKMELFGATMSDVMVPDAKKAVEKALREHEVEHLDRDIVNQGNQIVKEYEKSFEK